MMENELLSTIHTKSIMHRKYIYIIISAALSVCVAWVNYFSPIGIIHDYKEYKQICESTRQKGLTPCVVCGQSGHERSYISTGIGLKNPFSYEGPYIYCDRHYHTTPMEPFKQNWIAISVFSLFACFLLSYGVLIGPVLPDDEPTPNEVPTKYVLIGCGVLMELFAVISLLFYALK